MKTSSLVWLSVAFSISISLWSLLNLELHTTAGGEASSGRPDNLEISVNASIAYVTTIAFCASGKAQLHRQYNYRDGPTILAYSIKKAMKLSRYSNYKLYAIIHPTTYDCAKDYLQDYEILIRESPVRPEEVETAEYRHLIRHGKGCCGAREFLKLHAYNLTHHTVVVHFDTDSLLLKPLDELFDAMIYRRVNNISLMRHDSLPLFPIDAFITRDYLQGNPHSNNPDLYAMQGGFFVIRPSRDALEEMVTIIRRGNYSDRWGWQGSRIGGFYGAAQIQGFLAYYYAILHPHHVAELNRCLYNSMIYDTPHDLRGICRTRQTTTCQDCQITPLSQIKSIHYTTCQKPWSCQLPEFGEPPENCRESHRLWFQHRRAWDLEQGRATPPTEDYSLGYCSKGVYQPIVVPPS